MSNKSEKIIKKDAFVFASFVPTINVLYIAKEYMDAIASNFSDCDIFIGINQGSVTEWEELINSYKELNIFYDWVSPELTINSDASAFQKALILLKESGNEYNLIWFGHTKGTTQNREIYRKDIIETFLKRRNEISQVFSFDKNIGCYGKFIARSTTFGYTNKTLDSLYHFSFKAINTLLLHTFYVMRGSIVNEFIHNCDPLFFTKNLITHFGFDRYFFERDFPNISDKMGYKPKYEQVISHPNWNYTSKKSIDKLILLHQKNNLFSKLILGTIPFEMKIYKFLLTKFYTPIQKLYKFIKCA